MDRAVTPSDRDGSTNIPAACFSFGSGEGADLLDLIQKATPTMMMPSSPIGSPPSIAPPGLPPSHHTSTSMRMTESEQNSFEMITETPGEAPPMSDRPYIKASDEYTGARHSQHNSTTTNLSMSWESPWGVKLQMDNNTNFDLGSVSMRSSSGPMSTLPGLFNPQYHSSSFSVPPPSPSHPDMGITSTPPLRGTDLITTPTALLNQILLDRDGRRFLFPPSVDPPKFPPMEQPLDNDHPTDQEMNGTGTSLPKSLINQERQIAITEADTNNAQNNTKCHDDASTSPPPDSNCLINHEPSDRTVPSGPPSDSMGHPSLWNTTTPVHHGPSLDWSDTVAPSSWPGAVMNSIDPSGRYFCTTPAPGVPGASPSPGMTGGVSLPPLAFSPSPFGQKFPGSLPPANTPGALSVFRGGVTPGSSSLFWLLSGHGGSNHDELGMLDQTPAMGSVPSVSGPGDEGLNFFSPWKNLQSLPEVRPLETSPSVTPVPNPNDKDALISASSIDLPACALGEDPSGDPGAFGHRLDARRGSPSIVSNDLAAKSLGSINHPHDCRPCAFYWTKGCINGHDCRFCHLWHPPKKKKPMKEQKNLMIIARPDGKIEFMRCTVCEAMRVL